MNAIIDSVNKISKIKSDLNKVLEDNGIEGGNVFADYPDKFRELFRIAADLTEYTSEGYTQDTSNIVTIIPNPVITYYENIVTITCPFKDATIYYAESTASGNNNHGYKPLKSNVFQIWEATTVLAYAEYRGEKSDVVTKDIPFDEIIVPDEPVIVRNGTAITITCDTEDSVIWWSKDNGQNWYNYNETGPFTAQRYEDVMALARNYRGESDIVIDEAPEKPVAPDVPEISCSMNVVTITCTTENAEIWFKRITDNVYTRYIGPFTLTQSGFYVAKAVKNGLQSEDSDAVWCEFLSAPDAPSINVSNNTVYITCPTAGATIWYKIGTGEYQIYDGPITLTETVNIMAYAEKNTLTSGITTKVCTYVDPVDYTPEVPVISCTNNLVTITCATPNATIYYRVDGGNWVRYTGPIDISRTGTYEAYAVKNGYTSDISAPYTATYIEPSAPEIPATPTFTCTDNRVTISCTTPNAVIWYREVNSSDWTRYTGPFEITSTVTYVAYAEKNNQFSPVSNPFTAEYVSTIVVPNNPVINCVYNTVTITCSTPGATIYYSIDYSEFMPYISSFGINTTITVQAYSELDGIQSETVTKECEFIRPAAPVISCILNEVVITGVGTIYYSTDGENFTVYTGTIYIDSTCTIWAYCSQFGASSDMTEYECEYIEGVTVSPWVTAKYGIYNTGTPVSVDTGATDYTKLTSLSQIKTTKTKVTGEDRFRFVLYNDKLVIQLPDYSFVKHFKTLAYRINANNMYTTNKISSAYSLDLDPIDRNNYINVSTTSPNHLSNIFKSYSSRTMSITKYTLELQKFKKGVYYWGVDGNHQIWETQYQGTATADFAVPKIKSTTSYNNEVANTFPKFMQILLSRCSQSHIFDAYRLRFETYDYCNVDKGCFIDNFRIVTKMYGVSFNTTIAVRPNIFRLLYNAYYIELS